MKKARYTFADSVNGSTFFLATGFNGLQAIIATLFNCFLPGPLRWPSIKIRIRKWDEHENFLYISHRGFPGSGRSGCLRRLSWQLSSVYSTSLIDRWS